MLSPNFANPLGTTSKILISDPVYQKIDKVITKRISEEITPIDNFSPSQKKVNEVFSEGECYLRTKQEKFKKHWVVIMGNELYCYKDQKDPTHIIMHSLTGIFVRDLAYEIHGDDKMQLWPIKLILPPNKSRVLYFATHTEQQKWVSAIKQCICYSDILEYYKLDGGVLGKGQFGQVKLATHHSTGYKTAVKIVKKREMKPIEQYQQRKEIEVLKMCQHPNIVKMLDLFENLEQYYLVLEYMEGKDMFDYLRIRNFKISEDRAKDIMYQLILAVQYLHSYGIVHRDLKLENIMMSDNTEMSIPKLADFGLAKIIGPSEKSDEPFGTLGYVAPEVLKKELYGVSCDLWSLGCICYALLSGSLPFDHQSQSETIKMTMYSNLVFDLPCWKNVSDFAKDFISGLLIKDPLQRLTIEKALQHPWIRSLSNKF